MEEHRRIPMLHLIPDEESADCRATVHHPIANTAHASPLDVYYDSSSIMQRVGSTVIHHQAAIINRRLLAVQKRAHDAYNTDDEDEPPRQRRRRDDTATPEDTNDGDNDGEVSADQEQVSIVRQVERMKRMSFHLKNARIAQELFLRDMQECLQECRGNV